MAEQKWTKIGDVVGAAGGSEVREYGTFPVGLFKQYEFICVSSNVCKSI
jgi:hypothetical protein